MNQPQYLEFKEYQLKTRRTVQTYLTKQERHYQNTIGLIGETCEVAELLLDQSRYIRLNKEDIIKELGDTLWYMSRLLDDWDIPMEKVAKCNDMYSFSIRYWIGETQTNYNKNLEDAMKYHAKKMVQCAGKVVETLKKHFFQKHDLNLHIVTLECKKLLVEMSNIAFWFGCTLEDIALANLEKSAKRYPNGFTGENSIKRIDEN